MADQTSNTDSPQNDASPEQVNKEEENQEANNNSGGADANPEENPSEKPQSEVKRPKRDINVEEELKILKTSKEDGDKQMPIDRRKAIVTYVKCLEIIEDIKDANPDKAILDLLHSYEIKVNSNLALANVYFKNYEKAIEYDLHIIEKLDKNYDKSYARLLKSYVSNNEFEDALDIYKKMFTHFNKETLKKYADIFKFFEENSAKYPKIVKEIEKIKKLSKKWGKLTWLLIISFIVLILAFGFYYLSSGSSVAPSEVLQDAPKVDTVESSDILSS